VDARRQQEAREDGGGRHHGQLVRKGDRNTRLEAPIFQVEVLSDQQLEPPYAQPTIDSVLYDSLASHYCIAVTTLLSRIYDSSISNMRLFHAVSESCLFGDKKSADVSMQPAQVQIKTISIWGQHIEYSESKQTGEHSAGSKE